MPLSLVTGGAGFVGSHLVDALLTRGESVRVLDDFSAGTIANLPQSNPRLEIICGDVRDAAVVRRATEGSNYVFHLATPAQMAYSLKMAPDRWASSTDTLTVLTAAHQARVRRLIYSSCESVYGPAVTKPVTESDTTRPLSPYAFAKLTGEQQCVAFSTIFGLETVRLRYFNVFGPRQALSGARPVAIFEILKAMLAGQSPVLGADVQEPYDFIYVDDVVHANLLATEVPRLSGKVYNIARGRPTTLSDVVATINRILGTSLQPRCARQPCPEHTTRQTDIRRAETDLGFCPSTDLEQGLRQCIAYYRAHPEQLEHSSRQEPRNDQESNIPREQTVISASLEQAQPTPVIGDADSNGGW
jgi:UDP-glucose 4-epimerase